MSDFLIIGGGIAGISAAARLAPHGDVTVLEAEDAIGYHTSGRSAAMFEENYGLPSTVALNRASRAYHEENHILSPRGFLLVGRADEDAAFENEKTTLKLQEIGVAEATCKVPILDTNSITRAAFDECAVDIDTDLLLQGFARAARSDGAKIITRARVTSIEKSAKWRVQTTAGEFTGRVLINAAGAWADNVARMAAIPEIGLQPLRRSIAVIPAPGGRDVSEWPMLFGPGETWYAKPQAGKMLVSPAEEDPVEPHDAWADDMVIAEGIEKYQLAVTEEVTRVEHTWAGLRTFAPDRQLVIGFAPQDSSFFWLAGQGGYGMQSSPAASELVANLITGRTPTLDAKAISALCPSRFSGT